MGRSNLAHSVRTATARQSQKRVIPLLDRTLPPSPETIWSRTWFAIWCPPGWEWRVKQSLEDVGYTVFLPAATYWNASRFRVRRQLEQPLLVRYLFVGVRGSRMSDADRAVIRYTEGVMAVLGDSGGPLPIPHPNLMQLAGEIVSGVYDDGTDALPVGATVSIKGGPFLGFSAKLDQVVAPGVALDEPIRVILTLLGRETITHIPFEALETEG